MDEPIGQGGMAAVYRARDEFVHAVAEGAQAPKESSPVSVDHRSWRDRALREGDQLEAAGGVVDAEADPAELVASDPFDRNHDRDFSRRCAHPARGSAADEGFVGLYRAGEQFSLRAHHRPA